MQDSDNTLKPIVDAMREKFLKYWEDVPLATIIANCLHPSYRTKFTIRMVQRYKTNLGLSDEGVDKYVDDVFEAMFNIYHARQNDARTTPRQRNIPSSSSDLSLLQELEDDEDFNAPSSNMNELKSYCLGGNNDRDRESIDILQFWKTNATAYPTLAMMARDVYAIPVSTVPSESCFSSANRILTDKRSRLGPKVFERLVCLKDWYDAEKRAQHDIQGDTSGFETQESTTDPNNESDDEYDPNDNEYWYMQHNY